MDQGIIVASELMRLHYIEPVNHHHKNFRKKEIYAFTHRKDWEGELWSEKKRKQGKRSRRVRSRTSESSSKRARSTSVEGQKKKKHLRSLTDTSSSYDSMDFSQEEGFLTNLPPPSPIAPQPQYSPKSGRRRGSFTFEEEEDGERIRSSSSPVHRSSLSFIIDFSFNQYWFYLWFYLL